MTLRPGERAPVLVLFLWCFAGVGAVWLSRAVRDTLFLTHLSAARLPLMYIASPLAAALAGLGYVRFADRLPRESLIATSAVLMAGALVAGRALVGGEPWVYYALYIAV